MSKTVKCTRCGRENDASFAFCLDCGQSLRPAAAPQPATCSACGKPLDPGFRFCGHCGHPVAPPAPAAPPAKVTAPATPVAPIPPPAHAAVEPASSAPGEALGPASGLRLVAVRPDGVTAHVHALDQPEQLCGRSEGQIRVPDDGTVSPRHARFFFEGGALRVEDLGSVNGTYVRIRKPHHVAVGDEIRMGRQLLRLEPLPRPPAAADEGAVRAWGAPDPGCRLRLAQLLEGGGLGEIFPLKPGENTLGREAGDLVFPGDRYVSARHAKLDVADLDVTLTDLGSSNGTFVKTVGATPLHAGDNVLIGGQLFRVEA